MFIGDQCWGDCTDSFYLAFAGVKDNLKAMLYSPVDEFHDLYSAYCAK